MSLRIDKVVKGNVVFHDHPGEDVKGGVVGGVTPITSTTYDVLYTKTGSEPMGSIYWNEVDGTFDLRLKNNTTLQAGQEMYFYGKASGSIANGELCQFAGVQGDHILVKKVVPAEIIAKPSYLVGVATQNIANGDFGYITWFGKINGVYTKTPANNDSADWVAGDILYFDNVTGQLTKVEPVAPQRRIEVAAVVKIQTGSSENGIIIVRPTLSSKLEDLEDVDGSAPTTTGDLLSWNNTLGVWDRSTYNINDYTPLTVHTDMQDPTGWVHNEDIDISYSATNRTITLTGDLSYYWKGVKKTLTSPWTSDAHATGDGLFFLYSTDGTNFAWSTDVWKFYHIMVAVARKSTTPAYQFCLRELHGLMPWQVHLELHEQISSYRDSGGSLVAGTYAENTQTDVAITPSFDAAYIRDEDNLTYLPLWAEGTYTHMYVGASSKATFSTGSFPFRYTTSGYINYNTPATGAETQGATGKFYNVYQLMIPVTDDSDSQAYRMVMFQPQKVHPSLADAQAEDPRMLSLGDLSPSIPEFVLYARITYGTNASYSTTGKVIIPTSGVTYLEGSRLGQVSISGFTPSNHNDLTGLQGGTTDEYYHLTSAEYTAAQAVPTTYLKLDASNDPITGDLKLVPTANSTTTFQVFQQDGTTPVLNVDTTNANIGIGVVDPAYPLEFPATLGSKINLYDSQNYGFGMQSGLMQIFATSNTTRIGIGYGTSASFTETLTVKGANVGIGVVTPSQALAFGGNAAKVITMERHTTANTAGNSFTVNAGGATSGATDKSGGQLALKAGISTGAGGSTIGMYTAAPAATGAVSTVAVGTAGTGYTVGDVLTITGGGGNATVTVATLSGSAVATVTLTAAGTGYGKSNQYPTTGGTGTGCRINVTAITGTADNAITSSRFTITGEGTQSSSLTLRDITGTIIAVGYAPTYTTPVSSNAAFRTFNIAGLVGADATAVETFTSSIESIHQENEIRTTGLINSLVGIGVNAFITRTSGGATASATGVTGISLVGYARPSGGTTTTTITNLIGMDVNMVSTTQLTATTIKGINIRDIASAGTYTTMVGIDIAAQTRAATNIGLRIAAASGGATANYALNLSDTGGTAAGGITFGTDVTLYRSAADTLKTDDTFVAANISAGASVSGSNTGDQDLSTLVPKSVVDAKGDLLVASAADTVTRLAVGATDGHVLKVNSATATGLEWGAASGSSGAASVVNSEAVSGTKNGSNTAFTLANTPVSGSVLLYLNGQRLTITGDYTISGTAITMVIAPVSTDVLLADYLIDAGAFAVGSASFVSNETPSGTVNGSNQTFTLVSTPVTGTLALYRDGQLLTGGGADYTLTTNSIAFVTAPVTGSVLLAFYQSAASTAGNADTLDGVHASTFQDVELTGWYPITETFTYASASTITIASGGAARYQVGDKLKFTQTTVKYFVITAVADTLLTVAVNTDYTVANAAISNVYVSRISNPFGFPQWFTYAPTISCAGSMTFSSPTIYIARYSVNGRTCVLELAFDGTTGGTASNVINSTLPITQGSVLSAAGDSGTSTRIIASGSNTVGLATFNTSGKVSFLKSDASNWGLGATQRGYFMGSYEI